MLQTVDRALRLLMLYEEVDQEYRVGELAQRLGVDKSIASRLAATLAERGFLEREPGSEAFRLGPEMVRLSTLASNGHRNLAGLARAPMESLVRETGETANLARLEERKVVNVSQVDGPHLVGVGDWTGWKTEPHITANGKVLLAFSGEDEESAGQRSAVEVPGRELESVRSEGWASAVGEFEEGLNGVAVPIFDASGRCLAALSVYGPEYRMTPERLPEIAALCKKAAEEIRARLGKVRDGASTPASEERSPEL